MKIILHVKGSNFQKFKEELLSDEIVNRASVNFKDAKRFGKEDGYLCIVSGSEERCERALELAKGEEDNESVAKEVEGGEKEEILEKIKEEEDKAIEGFGNIFGG